jgi:hypothetical protein
MIPQLAIKGIAFNVSEALVNGDIVLCSPVILNFWHESWQAGPWNLLQDTTLKDLRNFTFFRKSWFFKHFWALEVDNVALLINQVTFWVDCTIMFVNEEIRLVFLYDNQLAMRVNIAITLDPFDVKLSERENLDEVSAAQIFLRPNNLAINVDDVAILINQIASLVNLTT